MCLSFLSCSSSAAGFLSLWSPVWPHQRWTAQSDYFSFCQHRDKSLHFSVTPHCWPLLWPTSCPQYFLPIGLPLHIRILSFFFWLCWYFVEFVEIVVLTFWLTPVPFSEIPLACWQLLPAWCHLWVLYICSLFFIQIAISSFKTELPEEPSHK